MRRALVLLSFVVILFLNFQPVAGAATLALKATWTANTESDMKEYRFYRTDGTRTLIGTIPHPETAYNFVITVPERSSGTATFVLTAVDTEGNQSADSIPASYQWNLDTAPPSDPTGLKISEH